MLLILNVLIFFLSIIVPVYMWWVTFLEIWALMKHQKESKTFNWLRAIIICSIKSIMTYSFNWKYITLFVQRANILPIHRSFPCPTKGLFNSILENIYFSFIWKWFKHNMYNLQNYWENCRLFFSYYYY